MEIRNELSWSRSRASTLGECARQYWFTYYGSWGGWNEDAPTRIREIYILKQLESRWMWVGSIVHDAIARWLQFVRTGSPIAEKDLVEWALQTMRADFKASRAGEYRKRPKKVCGLFEHEYKLPVTDADWGEVADHMKACVAEFFRSPYVTKLPKLPRGAWLPIEELSHFILDGVKIFVKPDAAFRVDAKTAEIIDWKTGRRDDEADPIQLACYALYALHQRWAADPQDVITTEYNLALGRIRESRMSNEKLHDVKGQMRASIERMKSMLDDVATNAATESKFPVVQDPRACRHCNFRRVCADSPLKEPL